MVMHEVVEECLAVAHAEGVRVPGDPHVATSWLPKARRPWAISAETGRRRRWQSLGESNPCFSLERAK